MHEVTEAGAAVPEVWPAGPAPGVYLTTSQGAIDALIAQYEEATDGALMYAERAGNRHDGAIDLGDSGLWSSGMDRVPSGALLVVGPIELDEESWSDARERVIMACYRAANTRHRVAILFDTPAPEHLGADATLLASTEDDPDLGDEIVGMVMEDGALLAGVERRYGPLVHRRSNSSKIDCLPARVTEQLRGALAKRQTGILAFGSMADVENPGTDLAVAGLLLTDHLGPAARIMPRHRSTMSKFDLVPESIGQLPFLPSLESAYAQGYRRFIIDPRYSKPDVSSGYVHDCLLIACSFTLSVDQLAMWTVDSPRRKKSLLPSLIAAVVVAPLPVAEDKMLIDLYIGPEDTSLAGDAECYEFVRAHRIERIEEQFARLVELGVVDLEAAGEPGGSDRTLRFLARAA
ncbi:hypothetical protein [Duganella sp. Root1480D1]|uniref:hypothetical protein n=1 Tax=Duganella sp. Root1480D1 TaxID=1736471 RepID=UPI00070C8673|nr:hypothetical protein [Duganella sp. Root1480D1]KQZ27054.1 hypothetical protein ASD58_15895 [Duganella sp. Root1480D1]